MIVEKQSAVLNCLNEIQQPLDADHHQLCKFRDRDDQGYISVLKTLESLLPQVPDKGRDHEDILQCLIRLTVLQALRE